MFPRTQASICYIFSGTFKYRKGKKDLLNNELYKLHLEHQWQVHDLSNLAIILSEKDLSYPLLMEPHPVVNEFAANKGRHLQ